jgi:nucleotide-binding universal stress UspA family protein
VYVTRHLTAQEILETYHEDTTWGASDGMKVQEAIEQAEGSHREEADKALAVAERMCAENGVPCEKVQLEDESPADGILQVADQKGCDVIFLSTHGNPGIMGVLFGTLASKVITHSKITVMVHHCGGPS